MQLLGERQVLRHEATPADREATREQRREVRHGHRRDHPGEPVLECGGQRRGVAAERDAGDGNGGTVAEPTDPRDQPPDVPHGLREAVHVVEQVVGRERHREQTPVAPDAVLGQHREHHVEPELTMQPLDPQHPEVEAGGAHPRAVHHDHPRTGLVVAQHDRRGRAVRGRAQPTIVARLARVGPVTARERQALETRRPRVHLRDVGKLERRWRLVVRGRIRQPSPRLEEPDRGPGLLGNPLDLGGGDRTDPRLVGGDEPLVDRRVHRQVQRHSGNGKVLSVPRAAEAPVRRAREEGGGARRCRRHLARTGGDERGESPGRGDAPAQRAGADFGDRNHPVSPG